MVVVFNQRPPQARHKFGLFANKHVQICAVFQLGFDRASCL